MMALTEILAHVDESPAAETRLRAAVELAAAADAHVSALFLVTEPFMRALVGRHLPEEFVRQHRATLERKADARLEGLGAIAAGRSVGLETRRETAALDHLPAILARQGRRADLIVVGPAANNDQEPLTEAAFMDTGRPALVVPPGRAGTLPPTRALVAWDGSREAARAAIPPLGSAEDVIVVTVDAHRAGARFSDRPGFGLTTYLTRHRVKARVKQVAASGGIADTILAQVDEERADLLVMGGYGHSRVREMMFGGVTRSIFERAPSPIPVSH
jgi:nucleotide-binding universal stress UspA family protein